jgi:hypothetical protein
MLKRGSSRERGRRRIMKTRKRATEADCEARPDDAAVAGASSTLLPLILIDGLAFAAAAALALAVPDAFDLAASVNAPAAQTAAAAAPAGDAAVRYLENGEVTLE